MPRGVDNSGNPYTTGTGRGGNHNYSVYDNSYDPFAQTGLPTEAGGYDFNASITNPNLNRPLGPGAVGQGTQGFLIVDEYGFDGLDPFKTSTYDVSSFDAGRRSLPTWQEIRQGITNWYEGIPEAAGEYLENMPIVKIGNAVYDGRFMSAAGDWLGGWLDSPWNPANWERGDPPEWSISVPGADGNPTTIAAGRFNEDYIKQMGYLRNSGGYSLASQDAEVGDTLTTTGGGTVGLGGRKLPQPGEEGYIHYGTDPLDPEDLDIPEGSFFNYITNQIESIEGDPYAYRRIDASNAWLKAGINDLKLTDEEWANSTEEEKQANWEARQEAAQDFYNFGVQGADPFGALSGQVSQYDTDVSLLKEAYLSGEYTTQDLERYYDGLIRSQGKENATNQAIPEFEELLASAGYSEEEIDVFSDSFTDDNTIDTAGVRSAEGFFDEFAESVDTFTSVDEDLAYTAYNLYDTKKEETYNQIFSDLDELSRGDMEAFEDEYYDLDIDMRNAYLSQLLSDGRISEESYKNSVITNLIKDGVTLSRMEDGTIRTGDNIYEDYRVLEFPELEDKEYTQEEINYARRNNLDLEADYGTDSPTSFAQGSDEWNERRERIARLDAGNVRFSATVEGLPIPEEKEPWEKLEGHVKDGLKTFGLNLLTSGLYSGVPAAENILKGEANSDDWKAIAPVFLESTGAITEDTGIAGLTPEQTLNVVDAVIDGNVADVVLTVVTPDILSDSLKAVGIPPDLVDDSDFIAGFKTTVGALYEGKTPQQALEDGLIKYVRKGGSFGEFDLPTGADFGISFDLDFDGLPDVNFGWIEDALREVGRAVDDTLQAVGDKLEPLVDAADDVLDTIGDVIEDVKDALPTGTTPEIEGELPQINIDTPEINIDTPEINIDTPEIDGPDIDTPTGTTPDGIDVDIDTGDSDSSPTRTTDYAFSDLFKFDTQVGISPSQPFITYSDLKGNNPFGRTI
jgi:hypothetical protein